MDARAFQRCQSGRCHFRHHAGQRVNGDARTKLDIESRIATDRQDFPCGCVACL